MLQQLYLEVKVVRNLQDLLKYDHHALAQSVVLKKRLQQQAMFCFLHATHV